MVEHGTTVWQTAATDLERAMPAAATPLVGRDTELAVVGSQLEAAAGGDPGLLVVAGDAGVGKTRFVREVADRAGAEGWTVLSGGCVELAEGAALLAPVTGVLRQLARDRGDGQLARLLEGPARWLAPLVPELGLDLDGLGSAPASQVLVSFHRLLRDLADEEPVLLVLEDLHWADVTTRDLLRHLATRLYDERLLVVATVRTDDLDRRHPLRPVLAEMVRRPQADRLDLAPLDDDDLVTHLAALSDDVDRARLAGIVARAGGNPFHAEQLLAAGGGGGLPPSLEDALRLRLERLPADTQQLLGEAAVLGVRVDPALLLAVSRLDQRSVRSAVRAALDDGVLLTEGDGYVFRHALLREVAREQLLPDERVTAHAAAAAALEADPDRASVGRAGVHGEAAHHWWQARDLPRCLAASVAAAQEAGRVGAGGAGLEHSRRALELWNRVDDPEEVTGTTYLALVQQAAYEAEQADDPGARDLGYAAVRAANDAGDVDARARATMTLTPQLINHMRLAEAVELTETERARHGDQRTPAASLAISDHATAVTFAGERVGRWDLDAVAADLDEALAMARECGDWFAEYRAQNGIATCLGPYLPHRLDESLPQLFALTNSPEHARDPRGAGHLATLIPYLCGDIATTAAAIEAWEADAATSTSASLWLWTMRWTFHVAIDTWAGRLETVIARIDSVDIRDHAGSDFVSMLMLSATTDPLLWTGQTARAVDRAEIVEATRTSPGSIYVAAYVAAALAAAGAPPRQVVAAAATLGEELGFRGWHLHLPRLVAAVATAAGDQAIDDDLLADVDGWIAQLERHVDWLRDDAPVRPWATTRLQQAQAERAFLAGAPDPTLWDPVVTDLNQRGSIPYAAVARLRRATARAAEDGGASPACEDDLVGAWRTFRDIGMTSPQDDAVALARRLRIDLPEYTDEDHDDEATLPDLTDREREVLTLVAQGWTNKQVGEHLFISPKTVSVHMSNTMRKLDVDSRTQAVALAHRAGLLPED